MVKGIPMKPETVFKRYDVRGKYPEEIDEEFAEIIGKSLGTFSKRNISDKVVVTRDNKKSSEELKDALINGLKSTGVTVLDAGEGPTDYTALTGNFHEAVSVQVTSSHLSLNTNGFKFMYPEGNGFVNQDLEKLENIFIEKDFIEAESSVKDISETATERYRDEAKKFFSKYFSEINRKVVVETMGGAGEYFLPSLLEELGAEVIKLEKEMEGPYIDPPNPTPDNLGNLKEKMEEENVDLGIATDMDADRLKVCYKDEWISGDRIFALLAKIIQPDKLVASIDTSRIVEENIGEKAEIFYTRVGDPFVSKKMLEINAKFSGEPNGHYCFPEFVAYNSGTMSGLLVAASDIDSVTSQLTDYHSNRESLKVDDKQEKLENLKKRVKGRFEVISEVDGIKFNIGEATVLVRSSGSSPKLRFVSDAASEEEAFVAMKKAQMLIE